jgi:hypothetical protein
MIERVFLSLLNTVESSSTGYDLQDLSLIESSIFQIFKDKISCNRYIVFFFYGTVVSFRIYVHSRLLCGIPTGLFP